MESENEALRMDNKILVTRSSMPSMEEYIEEIRSIWDSHWLTNMGEKHKALQAELQKYMGVPAVELLTNGHMALELSLRARSSPRRSLLRPPPTPSCAMDWNRCSVISTPRPTPWM